MQAVFDKITSINVYTIQKRSDYGCTWPDAIRIKGSLCQAKGVDLVA